MRDRRGVPPAGAGGLRCPPRKEKFVPCEDAKENKRSIALVTSVEEGRVGRVFS